MMGRRFGWLWRGSLFVALFNGALLAWLLVKPGNDGRDAVQRVDDVAQFAGPALMLPLLFWAAVRAARSRPRAGTAREGARAARWAPLLLALGILCDAVGQGIWTYDEVVLRRQAPSPSAADIVWLCIYPLLLLGILLLPSRPLPAAARTRILLDGLMIMTAAVTFSWYFVLGPNLLQGDESLAAKVVNTAYPLGDLVAVFALLVLGARARDPLLRPVVRLLSLGLLVTVATDSVYGYETLEGAYATGAWIDVGWPLGDMLIGLAAYGLARAVTPARTAVSSSSAPAGVGGGADVVVGAEGGASRPSRLWRVLLPYLFVPAVGGLDLWAWRARGDEGLEGGVVLGSAGLIGLVLLRQVLAIVENRALYDRLAAGYRRTVALNEELRAAQAESHANNRALSAANARLQTLATTDPLTGLPNHRAIVGDLDHELERARRYSRPCAVLFLDLDHFKALNDGCGHPVGDAALRELAALLRSSLRGVDTLGRWGGEEFVALLPETDPAEALAAAEHLRADVAAHLFAAGGGARLTLSVGVASYPHDGLDRPTLVAAADRAMYAAKGLGRNQVRAAGDPAVAALGGGAVGGSREEAALAGTVEALASLVEARDRYTGRHTREVAGLTMRLALASGCDAGQARLISLAARLRDVGKVAIPDAILQKPGRLSDEEWALMRAHPAVGAGVVGRVPALRALAPLIRGHHERWDGAGYPDGLRGEETPRGARIIAVADAYAAMTTGRPYRAAIAPAEALAELRRCAGAQFDPSVVVALERILAADPSLTGGASVA